MTRIGGIGQGPKFPVQGNDLRHKVVVVDDKGKPIPTANPDQSNIQQQFQQGILGQGVVIQGQIPGAQGNRSLLGVVNNPGALLAQAANQAAAGAQLQQMSSFAIQAFQAMGLGNLPQVQQLAMMQHIGMQMVQHAQAMGAQALAQSVFPSIPGIAPAIGNFITSSLNRGQIEGMGNHFLSILNQQPAVHWGRTALGILGPQYFNNFDPRTLAAMPNQALMPFSNQLMGLINQFSPLQLGQQMLPLITPQMQQLLGNNALKLLNPAALQTLGQQMLQNLAQNPIGAADKLLQQLGLPTLRQLGQKLFQKLNLQKVLGQDLANRLMQAIGQNGNIGKNILNALKGYFQDKLMGLKDKALDFLKGKLSDWGKQLLGKLGNGFLGKAGKAILDFIGKGKSLGDLGKSLLSKFGGKILDKLGGVGKIADSVLSILNGKFDATKALKLALNFIPGVGPILGALSNMPIVGKVFDKVLGAVGKVLNKIPIVKNIFKGINKIGGAIGKIGKKVFDGVKKVGKKILGGIGKMISKI